MFFFLFKFIYLFIVLDLSRLIHIFPLSSPLALPRHVKTKPPVWRITNMTPLSVSVKKAMSENIAKEVREIFNISILR